MGASSPASATSGSGGSGRGAQRSGGAAGGWTTSGATSLFAAGTAAAAGATNTTVLALPSSTPAANPQAATTAPTTPKRRVRFNRRLVEHPAGAPPKTLPSLPVRGKSLVPESRGGNRRVWRLGLGGSKQRALAVSPEGTLRG